MMLRIFVKYEDSENDASTFGSHDEQYEQVSLFWHKHSDDLIDLVSHVKISFQINFEVNSYKLKLCTVGNHSTHLHVYKTRDWGKPEVLRTLLKSVWVAHEYNQWFEEDQINFISEKSYGNFLFETVGESCWKNHAIQNKN